MLTAKQENARTLASALGIQEDEAGEMLKCRVVVTHDQQCELAKLIATHTEALLNRMIDQSVDNRDTNVIEILIGNARPSHKASHRTCVQISSEEITISSIQTSTSVVNPKIHPVFAIVSACYAAAHAVQRAIFDSRGSNSSPVIIRPTELLGEDLHLLSQTVDLGETVLAGAGAVANGFLYGLQLFSVSGTLHIVDPKNVAPGILNRCLWFDAADIGHPKSERLSVRAQRHFPSLQLIPTVTTVSEFVRHDLDPHRIERLIVSVDSPRARRSLQTEFPRELYDASTTGTEEVVLHFNRRSTDLACMSCIYRESKEEHSHEAHVADLLGVSVEEVKTGFISEEMALRISRRYPGVPMSDISGRAFDTLFKQLCGIGALKDRADRQVLSPFSFVPVLAGTYLAIEVVRRLARGVVELPYNYWRASPWTSPNTELRQLRRPIPDCEFCANPLLQSAGNRIWLDA